MQIKKGSTYSVPILLVDTSGNALTGKLFGDVTFFVQKANALRAPRALASGDLTELGNGSYLVNLVASDFDTVGAFRYWASCVGSAVCESLSDYDVTVNLVDDVATTLGTPTGASVSADVASVQAVASAASVAAQQAATGIAGVAAALGTPAGASVSADVAAVQAAASAALAAAQRAASFAGVNRFATSIARDINGKPTSYRIDYYDTEAHANLHDGVTGLLFSCTVTATYSENLLTTFLQAGG